MSESERAVSSLLGELGGLIRDAFHLTTDTIRSYIDSLTRTFKRLVVPSVIVSLAIFITGYLTGERLLLSISLIIFGVVCCFFLLLTLPIWAIFSQLEKTSKESLQFLRIVATLLFWSLSIAFVVTVLPLKGSAAIVILVSLLLLAMADALFGQGLSPELMAWKIKIILLVTVAGSIVSFAFPTSYDLLDDVRVSFDKKTARELSLLVHTPKRIEIDNVHDLDQTVFFHPETGKPIVWCYLNSVGTYEFYKSPGKHPTTGDDLQPVTRQIITDYARTLEQRLRQKQSTTTQSLVGNWSGTVNQPGFGSFSATMELNGAGGGSMDYPSLGCGGSLRFVGERNGRFNYIERITYGRDKCIDGHVEVRPTGNGVDYEWSDGKRKASGTLETTASNSAYNAKKTSLAARQSPAETVRRHESPREHVVRPGETLASIARRYNIHVEALRSLNDLQNRNPPVGLKLRLPASSSPRMIGADQAQLEREKAGRSVAPLPKEW